MSSLSDNIAYVHEHSVTFDEVDAAGIAFFAHAYVWAHRAYEAWLDSLGLTEHFDTADYLAPLVRSECDHHGPARRGDRLRIAVSVDGLGSTSVTLRAEITCGERAVATVRFVSVFVDPDGFNPMPIPQQVRRALQGEMS